MPTLRGVASSLLAAKQDCISTAARSACRGELKTASIPLTSQPPTGQNVPITVNVKPVPGEQVTDNNKGEFTAIFTH